MPVTFCLQTLALLQIHPLPAFCSEAKVTLGGLSAAPPTPPSCAHSGKLFIVNQLFILLYFHNKHSFLEKLWSHLCCSLWLLCVGTAVVRVNDLNISHPGLFCVFCLKLAPWASGTGQTCSQALRGNSSRNTMFDLSSPQPLVLWTYTEKQVAAEVGRSQEWKVIVAGGFWTLQYKNVILVETEGNNICGTLWIMKIRCCCCHVASSCLLLKITLRISELRNILPYLP